MASYIHVDSASPGGAPGDGIAWATAYTSLSSVFTTWSPGNLVVVASNHSEPLSFDFVMGAVGDTYIEPMTVIRVNTVDYSYAGKSATPNFTDDGSKDLTIDGNIVFYGLNIDVNDDTFANNKSHTVEFIDCVHSTKNFTNGSASDDSMLIFTNTDLIFKQSSGSFTASNGMYARFNGGSISALNSTARQLFRSTSTNRRLDIELNGVDLSGWPDNSDLVDLNGNQQVRVDFSDCIMPTGYTLTADTLNKMQVLKNSQSDSAGNNVVVEKHTAGGVVFENESIYLGSGFSVASVPLACQMIVDAQVTDDTEYQNIVCDSLPISGVFYLTPSKVTTFEVEFIHNFTALDKKNVWLELSYPGGSGTDNIYVTTLDMSDVPGSLDSSSSTWNGTITEYTKHKFSIVTNGTTIPHPQRTDTIKAVIRLGLFESGKDLIYNPQVTVTQ